VASVYVLWDRASGTFVGSGPTPQVWPSAAEAQVNATLVLARAQQTDYGVKPVLDVVGPLATQ
jgi:hypothetical protein